MSRKHTYGLGSTWILGQHVPAARHAVLMPLALIAGLALGTGASLLSDGLDRGLTAFAGACVMVILAALRIGRRAPRPVLAGRRKVNRQ